jgi:hypothetical protein
MIEYIAYQQWVNRKPMPRGLVFLFAAMMMAVSLRGYSRAEDDRLLFRSGFEPHVYVTPDYRDIRGADGMDWQRDLEERVPYARSFSLNYCAPAPACAWARIIDDPTGNGRGRVLHMRTLDDEPGGATVRVQNEFNSSSTEEHR